MASNFEALAQRLFNASTAQVTTAILTNQPIASTTPREFTANLAALLELSTTDISAFLYIQPPQSTHASLTVETLDRTLALLQLYSRVTSLIGEVAARSWLVGEKKVLEGSRPLDFIRSRVGAARLEAYLGALEDGAYA